MTNPMPDKSDWLELKSKVAAVDMSDPNSDSGPYYLVAFQLDAIMEAIAPSLQQQIDEAVAAARIDELGRVWGGMNDAAHVRDNGRYSDRSLNLDDLSYYLHNRERVLQGKKAHTPDEWLEAQR